MTLSVRCLRLHSMRNIRVCRGHCRCAFVFRSIALLSVLAFAIPGCHHFGREKCETSNSMPQVGAIPFGAPEVLVVGECASTAQHAELQLFTDEIRDNLVSIGGLRLLSAQSQCSETSCGSACPSDLPSSDRPNMDLPYGIHPAIFTDADMTTPCVTFPDEFSHDIAASRLIVRVMIDEFRPYAPMKLATTITVQNASTREEYVRIQKTWHSQRESNSCRFTCPQEVLSGSIAGTDDLRMISPARFLQSVASELAPAIHAECLSPQCSFIELD